MEVKIAMRSNIVNSLPAASALRATAAQRSREMDQDIAMVMMGC